MYTKEEASAIRQSFWIAYGKYMSPVPGADGEKRNWINYKTHHRHVKFRLDALHTSATCRIEITGEQALQQKIFSFFSKSNLQFIPVQVCEYNVFDDFGTNMSVIIATLPAVSVFRREDWPSIISFLKSNSLIFDTFWTDARDIIDTFA